MDKNMEPMKSMMISSKLRTIFGPLLKGEPTIYFESDGSALVYINDCKVDLNKAAMDQIYDSIVYEGLK